jgi:type I restriction enzyme M protein
MLVGDIRNQIDDIWNDFWSGGVSNPISVIEQLTYLLFIRRLDELQTVEERKAEALKKPVERRIFPEGADDDGEPYENLRWSRFKGLEAREMFRIVDRHVFPFLREKVPAPAFPRQGLPRLRLRPDHAADRLDEHDPARG